MERDKQLFCSASMCQLPIRRGDLYHRFWNTTIWRNRLLADEGSEGTIACFRHFSPKQYSSAPHKHRELKDSAIPDQRIFCCRFCLDPSGAMERIQSVSSPDASTITLQDIVETIGIQINPEQDEIPALICLTCSTKVRYIKRIQRQFQASDRKMRQMSESWKKDRRELGHVVEPATKQYPPKTVKIAQKKRKVVSPAKPPDEPGPVQERIVSRLEVKSEPGVVTEQIVDSSGSVFMIETLDVFNEEHVAEDPLEHRHLQQEQQSEENSSGHVPPIKKKVKVEEVEQEIFINIPWTSEGPEKYGLDSGSAVKEED